MFAADRSACAQTRYARQTTNEYVKPVRQMMMMFGNLLSFPWDFTPQYTQKLVSLIDVRCRKHQLHRVYFVTRHKMMNFCVHHSLRGSRRWK